MADAYFSTSTWSAFVQTAYDRAIGWYLRDEPQFREIVDVRPVEQAMPGAPVTLTLHTPLTVSTATLSETVDPDFAAPPAPVTVQVTPNEYGLPILLTLKLDRLAFNKPDMEKVKLLADNQADTLDQLVRTVLDGATNKTSLQGGVLNTTVAPNSITATDVMNAKMVAANVAFLRRRKVNPKAGPFYVAYTHPDVAHDIRREALGNTWADPHTYGGDISGIYRGAVGNYAGAQIIETTRTTKVANTVPVQVYNTYFLGQQALVEANVVEPHVTVGTVPDRFNRFFPLAWYGFLGWNIYRQEAISVAKTTSTLQGL